MQPERESRFVGVFFGSPVVRLRGKFVLLTPRGDWTWTFTEREAAFVAALRVPQPERGAVEAIERCFGPLEEMEL